ncbi:heterokaryon incompatibility protein-domain-containing protein [Halenospora varia]|nr:heterokaryon incompatibility protein-domain-containing protein [Halenospora varia]
MYSKRLSASRNEIRLLTVVPAQPQASASAEQSDLVRCTLHTYSTDKRHKKVSLKLFLPEENEDSPIENKEGPSSTKDSRIRQPPEAGQHRFSWGDYACLSYTWGDPTDTTDIVVNGDTIAVSSNLERALRTLRNRGEFPGHFKLWVDAICINQENAEERSQQVQKMEDIYDGAWNVVVWLGAEADGSEKAFTLLRTLSNLTPGELNELPQDLNRNPAHLGELAMGQPDMPVICGNSEIDWESLCKGLLFMNANKGDLLDILIKRDRENAGLEQDPPSWDLMASFAECLYAFVEIIHKQEDMPSFAHILAVSRQAQATDLKDKVYSMLGFMSSTVRNELRVDYTLTAREVYITAMKAFLWGNDVIGMSGLDLLRELDHVDTIEGVQTPSWVVDWSISAPFNAELRLEYSAGSWHHTKKSLLVDNLKFSVDRGVMSCQVIKLDYVDGLGAKSNHEQYPHRKMTLDTIVQPVKTQNAYDSPEEAKIALWRALLGDQTEFTKTTFAGSRSRYYV